MSENVPDTTGKAPPTDLSRAGVVREYPRSWRRSKSSWKLYTPREWIQMSLDEVERGESAHTHSDRFSDDWTTNCHDARAAGCHRLGCFDSQDGWASAVPRHQ